MLNVKRQLRVHRAFCLVPILSLQQTERLFLGDAEVDGGESFANIFWPLPWTPVTPPMEPEPVSTPAPATEPVSTPAPAPEPEAESVSVPAPALEPQAEPVSAPEPVSSTTFIPLSTAPGSQSSVDVMEEFAKSDPLEKHEHP